MFCQNVKESGVTALLQSPQPLPHSFFLAHSLSSTYSHSYSYWLDGDQCVGQIPDRLCVSGCCTSTCFPPSLLQQQLSSFSSFSLAVFFLFLILTSTCLPFPPSLLHQHLSFSHFSSFSPQQTIKSERNLCQCLT